jgi:hypothetical protein
MAINVNTVYQTVLLILNKEQRGYITPDEFNKTATQVQLDIFEQYFDDLNQQLRVPQADIDYSDRQMNIDEKISIFKCFGNCVYSNGRFNLPTTDDLTGASVIYNSIITNPYNGSTGEFSFHRLGTITYTNVNNTVELQRLQRNDFYNIQQSPLTKSTTSFPTYLYESGSIQVSPDTIQSNVKASFTRKPVNVVWAWSPGNLGQYIYDEPNSFNFELHTSEQVNVILKILQYSGIIIRDPQIVQAAASEVAQNEINKKN